MFKAKRSMVPESIPVLGSIKYVFLVLHLCISDIPYLTFFFTVKALSNFFVHRMLMVELLMLPWGGQLPLDLLSPLLLLQSRSTRVTSLGSGVSGFMRFCNQHTLFIFIFFPLNLLCLTILIVVPRHSTWCCSWNCGVFIQKIHRKRNERGSCLQKHC